MLSPGHYTTLFVDKTNNKFHKTTTKKGRKKVEAEEAIEENIKDNCKMHDVIELKLGHWINKRQQTSSLSQSSLETLCDLPNAALSCFKLPTLYLTLALHSHALPQPFYHSLRHPVWLLCKICDTPLFPQLLYGLIFRWFFTCSLAYKFAQ